jgi:hypothetical protein
MIHKPINVGEGQIDVPINVTIVDADCGEYVSYCYSVRGQRGAIISLPFFSYNKDGERKYEGHLIYHDKDGYGMSEANLYKLGIDIMANPSLSGMAGNLTPLPYKPIGEDEIENALDSLIAKNTFVELSKPLSL